MQKAFNNIDLLHQLLNIIFRQAFQPPFVPYSDLTHDKQIRIGPDPVGSEYTAARHLS